MNRAAFLFSSCVLACSISAADAATPVSADPDDVYWDNRISAAVAGVDSRVAAIATYQGELIVGGYFTLAGGVISPGIAAWNGSTWSPLGSGAGVVVPGWSPSGGNVTALTLYEGKLIAGGGFNRIGGVEANGIAAWDGVSWTPLGSGIDGGTVSALAVYDGKLIAAGNFTSAGGTSTNGVATWDGSAWVSLGALSPANMWIAALTVYEDRLIAGGNFTAAGGAPAAHLAAWDGTSWSALGAGAPWYVFSLTVFDGKLIVGGGEDTSSSRELRLVSWDGGSWTPIIPASEHVFESIYSLGVSGNTLVVGGDFGEIGGIPAASIAAWNGTSWSGFSPGNPGVGDPVASLTVFNGRLIAGGPFVSAGPGIANHVAGWDGAIWSPLGSGVLAPRRVSSPVSALAVFQGQLIAGGVFTMAGDAPADNVAAWNGSSWSPMLPEFSTVNWVSCLAVYGSRLFISEAWPTCNDLCIVPSEAAVAYWEGTSLVAAHGFSRPVHAFATYGNQLVAGGEFTRVGNQPANRVASWDGQAWAPLGGGTNGDVSALAVYGNKLIVAGFFTSAGGVAAKNIAAWDGASWSALGDGVDLMVNALAVYDGKLIAGGGTNFFVSQNFLTSWDGSSWSSLGSGTNGPVYALTVYDNDLVVGGNFTMAGGKPSLYLALWTKQEVKEVAVDVRPGSCPNPINVNPRSEVSQGVVPVAVLGTDGFDVREIDPGSVMLEGVHALRWNYADVAAPAEGEAGDCNCTTEGPDGYDDLELLFSRSELTSAMSGSPGAASDGAWLRGRSAHGTRTVRLEGQSDDGSTFEGSDCVMLVGGREAPLDPERSVRDLEVRSLPGSAGSSVQISFTLTGTSHVKVAVYDVLGREVVSLIDESRGPGPQSVVWNGDRVASGIYYYRIQADRDVQIKELPLLK